MIRTRNERVLIDMLRENGPMTRQQLAKASSLTLPAIAGITTGLVEAGLVREYMPEQQAGARGRPPMMVEFLPESSFVIGIRLGRVESSIVLADALGRELRRREIPVFEDARYEIVVQRLVAEIGLLLDEYPAALKADKAVGVCVQGRIDSSAGLVREAPRMGWTDVPLMADLHKHLNLPIYPIEAGRASAVAELIEGKAQGFHNVAVIDIGAHVSAGIIIGGRMINGAHGLAGNLGDCHFPLGQGDQPDLLVDSVLSTTGAYNTFLQDHGAQAQADGSAREAVNAAARGDEAAMTALLKAGEVLCYSVSWIANLFNPELIILSGGITAVPEDMRAPVVDQILNLVSPSLRDDLAIEFSDLGLNGWSRGAVLAGLQTQNSQLSRLFDTQQVL